MINVIGISKLVDHILADMSDKRKVANPKAFLLRTEFVEVWHQYGAPGFIEKHANWWSELTNVERTYVLTGRERNIKPKRRKRRGNNRKSTR